MGFRFDETAGGGLERTVVSWTPFGTQSSDVCVCMHAFHAARRRICSAICSHLSAFCMQVDASDRHSNTPNTYF